MELRYYRYPDTSAPAFHGDDEERIVKTEGPEVVVFFIPNAAHLIPSDDKWNETREYYSSVLQKLLSPEEKPKEAAPEAPEPETPTVDASMDETEDTGPRSDMEPTHYSKIDVNSLKVICIFGDFAFRLTNCETSWLLGIWTQKDLKSISSQDCKVRWTRSERRTLLKKPNRKLMKRKVSSSFRSFSSRCSIVRVPRSTG